MARANFTKRYLESLPVPPAGGRVTAWDATVPGLGIRVSPAGRKTFFVQTARGGVQQRATLGVWRDGPYPATTIDQARTLASEALARAGRGEGLRAAPPPEPAPEPAGLTLAALWPVYLDRHARPRKRTVRCDEGAWRLYLEPAFGAREMAGITRGEVAAWHVATWQERGAATANRALALLRIMYQLAGDWELYPGGNPAARVLKAPEEPRQRAVEREEFPALFRAVHGHPNEGPRDAILLSLFTGQRIGNVLAMRRDQITTWTEMVDGRPERRGRWLIPRTKNSDPNGVALVGLALDVLDGRPPSGGWIFPGRKTHLVGVSHAWAAIKKAAVLECPSLADLRLHDLRRTMASWQARTGATLTITGASLGHRSLETTKKVYAIVDIEPRRIAMEAAVSAMERMSKANSGDSNDAPDESRPTGSAAT